MTTNARSGSASGGRRPSARLLRRRTLGRWLVTAVAGAAVVGGASLSTLAPSAPAWAAVQLNGTGSSFAAPAVEQWTSEVKLAPYSLVLNYSSSSSGQGRYEFTNETTDFAVSDTGYVSGSIGTQPPSFPFIFVPITAAGVAFMYNVPGLDKTLQLSSYSACAILTGGITNWDDPAVAADNPGASLPNLTIKPVTESDTAGTNYVLEEWCIAEQPALWAAFANHENSQPGGPTDGVPISATAPTSNWPGILPNGLDDTSTTAVAGDIAANPGAIGAVQLQYAVDQGFNGSNPAKAVASVKNASGDYTQPTPVDVASALAYATQNPDGTHRLDFNGVGPHVYNPSTYSYLLTPTTGWNPQKGAVMSGFVNYVLTLGQQKAPQIGYASLGLSLERYGIDAVHNDVPGAVAQTAAEQQGYSCGDLTPAEVAAGQTAPTCGVTNSAAVASVPGSNGGTVATGPGGSGESSGSGGTGGTGGTGAGGVDAGVALSGGTGPLAQTGSDPLPLVLVGGALAGVGLVGRRRLARFRPAKEPS